MGLPVQDQGSSSFLPYDKIDSLRNEYLRELTGLSKILITVAIGTLSLTLAPLSPIISSKSELRWLVLTWVSLSLTAVLGFFQVFFFSSRFKAKADYLWASHLTDVVLQLGGSDERVERFSEKAGRHDRQYDRQYRVCVTLVAAQALALFLAYGFLARFMWIDIVAKTR